MAGSDRMREIRVEKVTLNIGVGEAGAPLEKAKAILEKISGRKAVVTLTHNRTTFGTPKRKPIGVKVTIRGKGAPELLKRLLQAKDNRIKPRQFDSGGNLSFGIAEYINIPGVKYDPDVGIMGMDVCVTLSRPGFRVREKRMRPGKVGKRHRITPEDAKEFMEKAFSVLVTEEEASLY